MGLAAGGSGGGERKQNQSPWANKPNCFWSGRSVFCGARVSVPLYTVTHPKHGFFLVKPSLSLKFDLTGKPPTSYLTRTPAIPVSNLTPRMPLLSNLILAPFGPPPKFDPPAPHFKFSFHYNFWPFLQFSIRCNFRHLSNLRSISTFACL